MSESTPAGRRPGRRILLITTDQQRYDTLGCTGSAIARTPNIDGLAAAGIRYDRAHPQSVVCMPSRATIVTGQHPATHGVWMNGVPLPVDAPSVAAVLAEDGFATALIGKAHFEPFMDPFLRFNENRLASGAGTLPHRGFHHLEFATHGAQGALHYARWMVLNHMEHVGSYFAVVDSDFEVNHTGGGDTGAPQVKHNPIPRELYHTDWVADRTIAWLDEQGTEDDWFCWMSFPDPHHPWDPPASELGRVDWRDVPLPDGYPETAAEREALLDAKPGHWRRWYDGELVSNYEAPPHWVPATLTADQVREVNAMNAIEMELIDEAIGRVLGRLAERGWGDDVDVIITTDHGELQGDFGLLFKGPYHVDALMRLPLIWRPAGGAAEPAAVAQPVGLLDIAPTLCTIAGVDVPAWMQGEPLPVSDDGSRERVLTAWDSELFGVSIHLRSMYRDGWLITACLPSTEHAGTEGELYNMVEDPLQRVNLWDDPSAAAMRSDLLADLWDHQPVEHSPRLELEAPV